MYIAITNATLMKKLSTILRSLVLGVEPKIWKSAYSIAHISVTTGLPSNPNIYRIKVPRLAQYATSK